MDLGGHSFASNFCPVDKKSPIVEATLFGSKCAYDERATNSTNFYLSNFCLPSPVTRRLQLKGFKLHSIVPTSLINPLLGDLE